MTPHINVKGLTPGQPEVICYNWTIYRHQKNHRQVILLSLATIHPKVWNIYISLEQFIQIQCCHSNSNLWNILIVLVTWNVFLYITPTNGNVCMLLPSPLSNGGPFFNIFLFVHIIMGLNYICKYQPNVFKLYILWKFTDSIFRDIAN